MYLASFSHIRFFSARLFLHVVRYMRRFASVVRMNSNNNNVLFANCRIEFFFIRTSRRSAFDLNDVYFIWGCIFPWSAGWYAFAHILCIVIHFYATGISAENGEVT